jgi:drug/metabolite transporter (DMT)-like permease
VGVAWGLAAALCWGLADYAAATVARQTGSFKVVVGFHVISVVALGVIVVASGAIDDISAGEALPVVWVGALGAASYAAFYKSLEIGPISIASPVISAYAAVTLVLAVIVLEETLTVGQTVAVAIVMVGVLLASADLARLHRIERRQALGIALALVTSISIGGYVFGSAYYAIEHGWLLPLFLGRGFSAVFLVLAASRGGVLRFGGATPRWVAIVGVLALVDTAGYAMFNLGAQRAETSIVSAASAPYAVIPIVAGVIFFRERPGRIQWVGVIGVIGGVVLLGLLS